MSDKPKGAIIGCGAISPSHFKAFHENGVDLVAACDIVPGKASEKVSQHGYGETRTFEDYHEMLALPEIEFVSVATPPALHAPMSLDALRAGKHVICEKPCVLDTGEADEIIRVSRETGKKLIFCCSRFRYGMPLMAKRYIDSGDLGDIYRVSAQFYRRRGRPGIDVLEGLHWFLNRQSAGAGVMMDMGVYFMDAVLWWTGSPQITAVSSTEFRGFPHDLPSDVVFDVEEHSSILARTAGDLTFTFDLAWISHHRPITRLTVLGTKGGVVVTEDDPPFVYYTEKGGPWQFVNTTTDWRQQTDGNTLMVRDFLAWTRGENSGAGTTPEEAARITELSLMAMQSAREGREVTLGELPGR